MTACEMMIDRMPMVAHGRDSWTPEEAAHLAACPECEPAWRLIQAAAHLGAGSAAAIDTARTADRVLTRVALLRRRARWRAVGWIGLAAAAAAVLVVSVGRRGPTVSRVEADTAGFRLPLAELEGLNAPQLESVLDGLDAPLGSVATPDAPALGDLEKVQLERVLRSLEG